MEGEEVMARVVLVSLRGWGRANTGMAQKNVIHTFSKVQARCYRVRLQGAKRECAVRMPQSQQAGQQKTKILKKWS